MSVQTAATRAPEVRYSISIAVSGAEPMPKRFTKMTFSPTGLNLEYRETASGWTLSAANVVGRRILKAGLGTNLVERLWVADADEWPVWIRDAIRQYAPKGSLR